MLAVMLLAVVVRLAMYAQLSASGEGALLQLHRWDQSDMHFYDQWAKVIASGDVLTDRSLHPVHDWHVAVAQAYLSEHPEQAPHLHDGATEEEIARAAWDDWYGGKRFHQHPLYPYLVAVTYAVLGEDVRWVYLWQMVLGVASTWLVMRIGCRHFGDAAGLAAGVLMALAGPVVFYECVLLRGPLVTFLGLAVVDLAGRQAAKPQAAWCVWLVAGIAGGLAMLAQNGMVLLVGAAAVVALAVGVRDAGLRLRASRGAVAVLAGAAVVLLPAMARNVWVGVGPLQLSSVGAVTFIATNGPWQHADLSFVASKTIPEVLLAARAGGPGVIARTLDLHASMGGYVELLGRKVAMTWRWLEKPNNVGIAYFAEHAWVLRAMPVRFAVVAPLALAGLLTVVRRHGRALVPLLPMLVLLGLGGLSCVVAAPHARYRAPLVMWLAPLAGLGVVAMWGWVRGGVSATTQARPGAAWRGRVLAAGVAVLFLVTLRPLPEGVTSIVVADWLSPYRAWWLPQSEARAAAGDWAGAAAMLEASFVVRPPSMDTLDRNRPATTADEADLARFYAAVCTRYGEALRALGQTQRALAAERRSMDLVEAAAGFEVRRAPPW